MRNALLILSLILLIGIWQSGKAQERYAILMGYNPHLAKNDTLTLIQLDRLKEEFWNDNFAMWHTLVEKYGYDDDKIFVAFTNTSREFWEEFDNNAYNSYMWYPDYSYYPITDILMEKQHIVNLFDGLANGTNGYPQITGDDFLFVQVIGEGGVEKFRTNDGDDITDSLFAGLLEAIPARKKVIWLNFCGSGCFLDTCANSNTYVLASTNPNSPAYAADDLTINGDYAMENEEYYDEYNNYHHYYHTEMNFHLFGALNGHSPGFDSYYSFDYVGEPFTNADENNDNQISLTEAYNWHVNHYSSCSQSPPEIPQVSDIGQMGLTTSLNYPTVINNFINSIGTIRGLACLTNGDKTLTTGHSLTIKENAKVDFIEDGWLKIENGANLVIESNVELNTNSDLNRLEVYGTLTLNENFNNNINIIIEDGGELHLANAAILDHVNITINQGGYIYLEDDATFESNSEITLNGEINNSSGSEVNLTIEGSILFGSEAQVSSLTSNNHGGLYIDNGDDIVVQDVDFSSSNLYAVVHYDDLTISDCNFSASRIDADLFSDELQGTCVLDNNVFSDVDAEEAVKIDGFNMFEITDNVFEDNSGHGLAIYNSGRQSFPIHHITGNVFRNNNDNAGVVNGVLVYQSVVSIGNNNKVYGNDIGLGFYHESNVSVYGDRRMIDKGEYQEIYDNLFYQVYATDNSFPTNFTLNVISDGGSPSPMIYRTNPLPLNNIEYNCWGDGFNSTTDLYPYHGFDYLPQWRCDYDPSATPQFPEVKLMYDESIEKLEDGDYVEADNLLKEIIENYPESMYAEAAIKTLPTVAIVEGNGFDNTIDYLKTNGNILGFENLAKTAGYTVANCHIYAENYSEALTFYEGIIGNPPTYEDYVFAIVDAGRVALLMEEEGKASHTFKYPELIPANRKEYKVERFNLLSTLIQKPDDIQNQNIFAFESEDTENKNNSILNGEELQKSMLGFENNQDVGQVFSIYPNPLNNTSTVQYFVEHEGFVKVKLFSTNGKLVETLVDKQEARGNHQVQVNAGNFEAGIYYVVFENDNQSVKVEKIIVIK